ncbi:MAG TPA: LacI family DNA-binding transcriptional regulator [Spirochaetia bacterium]|nr:LacI family DNA-binding transcriptional regulator [Spirochaetia bacterium]
MVSVTATIKDIAREAKVSYATVSRALNNKYGVHPSTQERILAVAKRLNYRPNAIARGLVTRQTYTIGLILPDITNPFFPEVARGVEEGAQEQGYSVFLCNTNWERQREAQYIRLLTERRVDGIVLAPISNSAAEVEQELAPDMSVVYVSNVPRNTHRSYVEIDNIRGGFLATKHLIDAGFRTIGFVGAVEGSLTVDERLEGFRMAFDRSGLKVDEHFVHLGHFRQETGYRIVRDMIEKGDYPRAIFAENDLIALGVMQGVRDSGLRVPADIAVVGFDDIPFASFREVQLSTVYQPKYEMGKLGAQILIDLIAKSSASEAHSRRVILEPELIVRGSTVGPQEGRDDAALSALETQAGSHA